MIEEDYVSFEVAKLLNEKGFNELTHTSYVIDSVGRIGCKVGDFLFLKNNESHRIAAPTLQMAMKWLRKVHKLHIIVGPYLENEPVLGEPLPDFKYYNSIYKENVLWDVAAPLTGFDTYEKAAEEAIKYCLTHLL